MKKELSIVVTLIGVLLTSLIFIQPAKTEAGNKSNPTATPRQRKFRPKPILLPVTKRKVTSIWGDSSSCGVDDRCLKQRKRISRKKRTGTRGLLPYMEQSNLRKKGKRKK